MADKVKLLEQENAQLKEEVTAIREELEKYRVASSKASEGLWDLNLKTGATFVSEPWKTMLGYETDELASDPGVWESLLHPEDREEAEKALDNFAKGHLAAYNQVFRLRHKDGSYRWIQSKAEIIRDESGDPVRIAGSHEDVTDQKRVHDILKKSERKYKGLFDNSLVGMFRVRYSTGELLEANQKTWAILGARFPIDSFNLENIYVTQQDREDIYALLEQRQKIEEREMRIKRVDDTETWISFSAVLVEEDEEKFIEVVVRDISEYKENLLELQRLNFELDNFVYHASHDIRSPLRSMLGLIEILKNEKNDAEKRKIIDMIYGSISRLDKFVVDLLSMSRHNKDLEEAVEFNFLAEINNSITNFYHSYTTKDLEILTKVIQPVPFSTDLTKVRVILNNLISNALKYRRFEEGLVSYINITTEVDEKRALFIIEDNGEGIPEDKIGKIFEMFYRASENSEGSGLGMYIVQNVIKKLDADIKVESKEGEGTRFEVSIPNLYLE